LFLLKELFYGNSNYADKRYLKRNVLLTTFAFECAIRSLHACCSNEIPISKYLFDISIYRPV